MLSELPVGPVIPVRDVDRARAFYEETLGLQGEPAPAGHRLRCGGDTVIYLLPSTDYPGTAAWPIASFLADDLRSVTADLRRRGVRLESFGRGSQQDRRRRHRRHGRVAHRLVPRPRRQHHLALPAHLIGRNFQGLPASWPAEGH